MTGVAAVGPAPMVKVGAQAPLRRKINKNKKEKKLNTFKKYTLEEGKMNRIKGQKNIVDAMKTILKDMDSNSEDVNKLWSNAKDMQTLASSLLVELD